MIHTCSTATPGRLVVALMACLACLFNSATGRSGGTEEFKPWHELHSLGVRPHDAAVRALAFSPDGSRLASGSSDHTVCVMRSPVDLQRPSEVVLQFRGHVFPVTFVAFDRKCEHILSAGQDLHVRVWRASDAKRLWELESDGPVALDPDGGIVAIGEGPERIRRQGAIRLVQLSDGAVLRTLDGHARFVRGVAFSPDGKQLVSSGADGFIRLWATASGELLQSAPGAGGSFSFGKEGKLLASASSRGTGFYLWDFPELKLLNRWHTDPVIDLAFVADARVLAVCTTTDVNPSLTLQLFRVSDGTRLQTLVHEQVRTMSIAFDPQRKLLAAGMSDGSIRFFTPQNEAMSQSAPAGPP